MGLSAGQTCYHGSQQACQAGLTCAVPASKTSLLGAAGTCMKIVGEGERCSGGSLSIDVGTFCDHGLVCKLDNPNLIGGGGVCYRPSAARGSACVTGTQRPCQEGLQCISSDGSADVGSPGTCLKVVGKGASCNLSLGPADSTVCAVGFVCEVVSEVLGANGTCVALSDLFGPGPVIPRTTTRAA